VAVVTTDAGNRGGEPGEGGRMDRQAHECAHEFPAEDAADVHDGMCRPAARRDGAGPEPPDVLIEGLAKAVRDEIVPRLVGGHRMPREPARAIVVIAAVTQDEVAAFAQLALDGTAVDAMAYVDGLRARGVTLEAIYVELLEPAARSLGGMWEADLCDFTAVTLGVGRIQQVLRELSLEFRAELECAWHGRRLLLAPAPGEQHTFGLFVVADFFARAGWDVWGGTAMRDGDLFRLVRDERFDLVGLSLGCDGRLDVLAANIRALRAASRNRDVRVLVGGPLFISRPQNATDVGADGTAASARQAVQAAERIVASPAGRG
jgi:MerR family transcriptional regulator, light-induced transcriptional regulator